ncbi:MAG: protein meaA [Sneathiella sp.]|uniref:protein meaA n=1 Tax=Sneathiella sp. TaxID=1964365 RepID=UPI003002134F
MAKNTASTTNSGFSGKDRPWLFRTYSGHSSATASNELYKTNLARGQTGLSVAFDLPTQTGYDSDHILARGEVGKVGVPICHLGDMRALFDEIPLEKMNTSMTINATSAWLLALYVAVAEEQGTSPEVLQGTVQNDIIKEYLSRGTYIFPPGPSMKLITDVVSYTYKEMPKWNPTNVCSYHLQEAGATPVQELSFALATAISVLDAVKEGGQISPDDFSSATGRISFFVNAGIRFITEMCKMRAFVDLWDEILLERYDVQEEKYRRFRYGVQVNSLGLTEQQPENNVYRILLEMLAVVLSKNARARAVQLPAWNEALGLPRPWDQQWSLRLQQIVAFETDLLEYGDIFEGSVEIDRKVEELKTAAREELRLIEKMGGAVAAVETGYLKECLVQSNTNRVQAVISGDIPVVGVNKFTETTPSPLLQEGDGGIMTVDPAAEAEQIAQLIAWREARDNAAVKRALDELSRAAKNGDNIMPASIKAAKVGVTTGEWSEALRKCYGEYRAPTGVSGAASNAGHENLEPAREKVAAAVRKLGHPLKVLIGKPGLDGHSNGAEQIAVAARDSGMDVVYEGIRLTPDQIVTAAKNGSVHLVGLSILSGSHVPLASEVCQKLNAAGLGHIPVIVGGIIPPDDALELKSAGVTAIYTPKDFDMTGIMIDMVDIILEEKADA